MPRPLITERKLYVLSDVFYVGLPRVFTSANKIKKGDWVKINVYTDRVVIKIKNAEQRKNTKGKGSKGIISKQRIN